MLKWSQVRQWGVASLGVGAVTLWSAPAMALDANLARSAGFLTVLIVALLTFLIQIVLTLVVASDPTPSRIAWRRRFGGVNALLGVVLTIYLYFVQGEGRGTDSVIVALFFGGGLFIIGLLGLKRPDGGEPTTE